MIAVKAAVFKRCYRLAKIDQEQCNDHLAKLLLDVCDIDSDNLVTLQETEDCLVKQDSEHKKVLLDLIKVSYCQASPEPDRCAKFILVICSGPTDNDNELQFMRIFEVEDCIRAGGLFGISY